MPIHNCMMFTSLSEGDVIGCESWNFVDWRSWFVNFKYGQDLGLGVKNYEAILIWGFPGESSITIAHFLTFLNTWNNLLLFYLLAYLFWFFRPLVTPQWSPKKPHHLVVISKSSLWMWENLTKRPSISSEYNIIKSCQNLWTKMSSLNGWFLFIISSLIMYT